MPMLAGRDQGYALLKLKSGRNPHGAFRMHGDGGRGFEPRSRQRDHRQGRRVTAGRAARPVSRGIARNPVDHPQWRRVTNGGKHWATPWGKPTKGKKTRNNKSTNKFIVRSRHDQEESKR